MLIETIKLLLNINELDETKDDLLEALIALKSRKVSAVLGTNVPSSLEYIIIELVIAHYNKLGSEGLAAESVEGISRTYMSSNELEPYTNDLRRFLNASSGKFRFY